MAQNNLPIGFISIDDAIKLIESDTRSNPVVDTESLVKGLPYLRVDGNYNIPLMKRITEGKYKGKILHYANKPVQIENEYDKVRLEKAIVEHFKEVTGRDIKPNEIGIRHLSTAVDDEANPKARIVQNERPMTKIGEDTGSGFIKTNQ